MKFSDIKNSNTFRVLFIGFLILLLLIPMQMVESVIHERSFLHDNASNEIRHSWGPDQKLVGPVLTLPYVRTFTAGSGWSYDARYKHLRPQLLDIDSHIETEIRYRSIYKVPVYTADIFIKGKFDLSETDIDEDNSNGFQLEKGVIQIPFSNSRSIKEPLQFTWNGEAVILKPEWNSKDANAVVFRAKLPENLINKKGINTFEYKMKLAGTNSFSIVSSANSTDLKMHSNWQSPGFFGIYLPDDRTISEAGFTSEWHTNDFLSDIGHEESELIEMHWFHDQVFGVNLVQTVNTYQVVTRAAKYAVLFIALTFMVYFFTELFGKTMLHPVQYLLVGFANCVFYLLLLSLAEHVHFNLAYLFSAFASTSLISLYSVSILKSRFKAGIVFVVLVGLYTYLFIALRSEGFALLIGSLGLFIILSTAMYLTRNIDWHKMRPQIQT